VSVRAKYFVEIATITDLMALVTHPLWESEDKFFL
jgi:hypothetical protein